MNRMASVNEAIVMAMTRGIGAIDQPINPMKQLVAAGATFVARTTHTNPNHVLQMMEAAMDHDGFSFIECLSECVEFYEGAFDASNPRNACRASYHNCAQKSRPVFRSGGPDFSRSDPL